MRIHYINLDAAEARRAALEANLAAVAPGVERVRFAAVTAEAAAAVPGRLSPPEKACFLSHRALLASRDPEETILVLEDDAKLSRATMPALEATLAAVGAAWDMLYADVAVPDRNAMLELIRHRRRIPAGQVRTVDLAAMPFAGAVAYVVRGDARARLNALLAEEASLDTPYDIVLRRLIRSSAVKAACVFPFVCTLADSGFESDIQTGAKVLRDLPLHLFRRLMTIDRDLAECMALAARMDALMCDDEARVAGAVFAGMASRAYDPIN